MSISVVVPTYNRAHTLPRALDSILAQTLPASEVLPKRAATGSPCSTPTMPGFQISLPRNARPCVSTRAFASAIPKRSGSATDGA